MKKEEIITIPKKMYKFKVGLGWKVANNNNIDLDVSLILIDKNGQHENIFYNNRKSRDGAVEHSGDNRTGAGAGDDEVISVDLSKISDDIESIWPVITIYNNGKQFDDVSGGYVRIFCPYSFN